jgi:hypothetical protein
MECFRLKLFGLPRQSLGWVQEIRQDAPLFLYNVTSGALFGVFNAASDGGYNINPRAWENMRPLEFPAQVMVSFGILHRLDDANKKFRFVRKDTCKLTKEQTEALVHALENAPEYKILPSHDS